MSLSLPDMAEDIIQGLRASWELRGADEDTMDKACRILRDFFFETGTTESGLCDTVTTATAMVESTILARMPASPDNNYDDDHDDDDDYDSYWKHLKTVKDAQEAALLAKYGPLKRGVRQPFGPEVPVWVTPDVDREGFPKPRFSASLSGNDNNDEWINVDGMARLIEMLETGAYSVTHPENCALLAVAALRHWGHVDEAENLLNILKPWINVLKLHPDAAPPRQPTCPSKDSVVQRVKEEGVLNALRWTQTSTGNKKNELAAKHVTAIEKKRPLYYDVIDFWAATVMGGWPCQAWPENWRSRAEDIVERAKDVNMKMRHGGRALAYIQECIETGPESLTPRSVGMLRKILADFELKYGGLPGNQLRGFQSTQRHPLKIAYAGIVASRLEKLINQLSSDDQKIQLICDAPVTEEEAAKTGLNKIIVQCGDRIPDSLRKIVSMCSKGTLEQLIDAGIITSAESLAHFIPPLVQSVMPIKDAPIRQFVGAIYQSFRNGRRTVVLAVGEGGQVRLEELPWFSAIMRVFAVSDDTSADCRKLMSNIAGIIMQKFPGTGIPNKMQQDLDTLMDIAGMRGTLIKRLAADIFCGTFTHRLVEAGIEAARYIRQHNSTLYEKFWGLENVYDDLIQMAELEQRMDRKQECAKFMDIITKTLPKSRVFSDSASWIAKNHQTIEWQQIVCTDNMATLVRDFALFVDLTKDPKRAMVIGCLRVAKLFSLAADGPSGVAGTSASAQQGKLRSQTKSTSALQQGTFLLSLLDVDSQASIVKEAASWEPKTKAGRFEREMEDLAKLVGEETKRDGQNRFLGILCVVGTLARLAW